MAMKVHKFDLLVSVYIFCICVAELMGSKTFAIGQIGDFKLNASVAIFVIPFLFTVNDMVVEVYGKERARSIIRSGLLVIFLLLCFSLLATALPASSRFLPTESAYDVIFGKSARIAAASLVAFALAEFLDVYVFSKLREKLKNRGLWLRNNLSNFIAQLLDTTVFMFLAFYALNRPFGDNFEFLLGLIIPYWLLKCFMSIIETPFVYLGVQWLRKDKEA